MLAAKARVGLAPSPSPPAPLPATGHVRICQCMHAILAPRPAFLSLLHFLIQVLASEAEQERMQAPNLAASTPVYLEPETTYILMPRSWLQTWRGYVNGASKRGRSAGAALPPHPPSLKQACQALLCSCHSGNDAKLAYPLPSLAHRYAIVHQLAIKDNPVADGRN